MRLTIQKIGAKGDGVAEYDGNPVFVDGALNEEEVDVAFFPHKGGVQRASVVNVVTPSPDRQTPPCKHYATCGGCAVQHMNDHAYQSWKYNQVKSTLTMKNIAPNEWLSPVFIGDRVRRRVTFSYLKKGKKLIVGYHKKRSKMISQIDDCLLLLPEMVQVKNEISQALSIFVPDSTEGSIFIQKADNGFDVTFTGALGKRDEPDLQGLEAIAALVNSTSIIRFSWRLKDRDEPQVMLEKEKPVIVFGNLRVPLSPFAFLQPSNEGQDALMNAVRALCPNDVSRMADLFSGCGTFTGGLLDKCAHIDAFESDIEAIKSFKKSGYKHVFRRDLFRDPLNEKELDVYDAIVIDPPRAGALEQMKMIAESDVKVVVSVSCNPTTFARDAQILIDGGYVLESLQMVDQFLWSDHAELIGKFTQK
jgi:23S rRNA (uracil1939-C5)-methyltransferase